MIGYNGRLDELLLAVQVRALAILTTYPMKLIEGHW